MTIHIVKFFKTVLGDNGREAEICQQSWKSTPQILLMLLNVASDNFAMLEDFRIGQSMRTE